MKGTVIDINHGRGMVAVETEEGEFSIFELLGDDVEVGDVVQWESDYPLGGETIRNSTQGERIEVYFQNHCVPKGQLRSQLLYDK
jgi:hypothetical protein